MPKYESIGGPQQGEIAEDPPRKCRKEEQDSAGLPTSFIIDESIRPVRIAVESALVKISAINARAYRVSFIPEKKISTSNSLLPEFDGPRS